MCYEKIPTKNLSHENWLRLRKTGLGGSDIGAICGVNKYSSPVKIYQDKTTDIINEVNTEATRIGHDLEDYCARRFTEETGLKVRKSNYMYRSKEHPFMIADVDRLVIGEDAGLECKTTNILNASEWKNGQIPVSYVMQCYHYMYCTGRKTWYIACVILGKEFVYRKLTWDDEIINNIISIESDFWNNHVAKGVMPNPDGSKSSERIIQSMFPVAKSNTTVKLMGFDEQLAKRDSIITEIFELEQEKKKIEQEIQLFMKDIEFAENDSYKIKWSNVETVRIDTQKLRKELPDVFDKYSKKTTSRRFQIKPI
ncbi:MAG: YqaJ viral recombinase family protein [Ruminococcus sp.]